MVARAGSSKGRFIVSLHQHSPLPRSMPLAAYHTWLICLSLEGRAYSVLGWRSSSLPSTQAGCLQSSSFHHRQLVGILYTGFMSQFAFVFLVFSTPHLSKFSVFSIQYSAFYDPDRVSPCQPIFSAQYPVSSVAQYASSTPHPVSSIQYPVSAISYLLLSFARAFFLF